MNIGEILRLNENQLTLIIGNGINRFNNTSDNNSWEGILKSLARNYLPEFSSELPKGISTTEFFDLLSLKATSLSYKEGDLQKEFCKNLANLIPLEHHKRIVQWAQRRNSPILTTNFDLTLSRSINARINRKKVGGFTDFYPWESYYSDAKISKEKTTFSPAKNFGIWHINGMEEYSRSIRLGLTHYMGSVQRARDWMHRGDNSLFKDERKIHEWQGKETWLDAFFCNDLVIIGLSLDEVEVFLRWILIERARLFKKFPNLRKKAWYVNDKDISKTGKGFFLENIGVKVVNAGSYDSIYECASWLH